MADRRGDKRFRLTEPADGELRVFPDVVVQQDGTDEWTGISRQPALAGETLVLDLLQSDAVDAQVRRRIPVRVVESRPVIVDGDIRHRIRLHNPSMAAPVRAAGDPRMSGRLECPATLTRELAVRVIDLSASGCLIGSRRRMEVGTIGTLRLRLAAEGCKDDVEVVHCDAVKGVPNAYHVGVRLLWTTPRHAGSIRRAAASQLAERDRPETARVM